MLDAKQIHGIIRSSFHQGLPSKTAIYSLRTMDYSPGGQKIKLAQKFMQVEVNVKCMETNFGGHGFSYIRDFTPFQNSQNFSFPPSKGKLWPILMANNKELAKSNCRSHIPTK